MHMCGRFVLKMAGLECRSGFLQKDNANEVRVKK